ncbi:MAG TPA: hypothetical protein VFD27_11335, partial [Chthoniobacteraceae bacterium]|nr:hypothetical protein [Chthoniobacteraceae bacterium]
FAASAAFLVSESQLHRVSIGGLSEVPDSEALGPSRLWKTISNSGNSDPLHNLFPPKAFCPFPVAIGCLMIFWFLPVNGGRPRFRGASIATEAAVSLSGDFI